MKIVVLVVLLFIALTCNAAASLESIKEKYAQLKDALKTSSSLNDKQQEKLQFLLKKMEEFGIKKEGEKVLDENKGLSNEDRLYKKYFHLKKLLLNFTPATLELETLKRINTLATKLENMGIKDKAASIFDGQDEDDIRDRIENKYVHLQGLLSKRSITSLTDDQTKTLSKLVQLLDKSDFNFETRDLFEKNGRIFKESDEKRLMKKYNKLRKSLKNATPLNFKPEEIKKFEDLSTKLIAMGLIEKDETPFGEILSVDEEKKKFEKLAKDETDYNRIKEKFNRLARTLENATPLNFDVDTLKKLDTLTVKLQNYGLLNYGETLFGDLKSEDTKEEKEAKVEAQEKKEDEEHKRLTDKYEKLRQSLRTATPLDFSVEKLKQFEQLSAKLLSLGIIESDETPFGDSLSEKVVLKEDDDENVFTTYLKEEKKEEKKVLNTRTDPVKVSEVKESEQKIKAMNEESKVQSQRLDKLLKTQDALSEKTLEEDEKDDTLELLSVLKDMEHERDMKDEENSLDIHDSISKIKKTVLDIDDY